MNERDEKLVQDINDTYAERDRGELTDQQWMDRLKDRHDQHKADVKADYDRRGGAR